MVSFPYPSSTVCNSVSIAIVMLRKLAPASSPLPLVGHTPVYQSVLCICLYFSVLCAVPALCLNSFFTPDSKCFIIFAPSGGKVKVTSVSKCFKLV